MTSQFIQVCPEQPINNVCQVPLVWVETRQFLGLTHQEFLVMLPFIIGALLGFKLFRITLKQFFNW